MVAKTEYQLLVPKSFCMMLVTPSQCSGNINQFTFHFRVGGGGGGPELDKDDYVISVRSPNSNMHGTSNSKKEL